MSWAASFAPWALGVPGAHVEAVATSSSSSSSSSSWSETETESTDGCSLSTSSLPGTPLLPPAYGQGAFGGVGAGLSVKGQGQLGQGRAQALDEEPPRLTGPRSNKRKRKFVEPEVNTAESLLRPPVPSRDPIALKRRRDPAVTPLERAHALKQGLSLETRARRKREWLVLREENRRLKDERAGFLRKIEELEGAMPRADDLAPDELVARRENELLRAQIAEHAKFIERFASIADPSTPKEKADVIYREGADMSQNFVASLFSQSQLGWTVLTVPSIVLMLGPWQSAQMSYSRQEDFFGAAEAGTRLNIRFDGAIKGCHPAVLADVMFRSFFKHEDQGRLYLNRRDLELKATASKMPDEHTKVVQFKRRWRSETRRDQDAVFLVTRERRLLAKSTMAAPAKKPKKAKKPQKPKGKANATNSKVAQPRCAPCDDFGKVSAICVAATTSALYDADDLASDGLERISDPIVKGCVAWAEGDETRFALIYSMPKDYQAFDGLSTTTCISPSGSLSFTFVTTMAKVAREFCSMLKETTKQFEDGTIKLEQLDVPFREPFDARP